MFIFFLSVMKIIDVKFFVNLNDESNGLGLDAITPFRLAISRDSSPIIHIINEEGEGVPLLHFLCWAGGGNGGCRKWLACTHTTLSFSPQEI